MLVLLLTVLKMLETEVIEDVVLDCIWVAVVVLDTRVGDDDWKVVEVVLVERDGLKDVVVEVVLRVLVALPITIVLVPELMLVVVLELTEGERVDVLAAVAEEVVAAEIVLNVVADELVLEKLDIVVDVLGDTVMVDMVTGLVLIRVVLDTVDVIPVGVVVAELCKSEPLGIVVSPWLVEVVLLVEACDVVSENVVIIVVSVVLVIDVCTVVSVEAVIDSPLVVVVVVDKTIDVLVARPPDVVVAEPSVCEVVVLDGEATVVVDCDVKVVNSELVLLLVVGDMADVVEVMLPLLLIVLELVDGVASRAVEVADIDSVKMVDIEVELPVDVLIKNEELVSLLVIAFIDVPDVDKVLSSDVYIELCEVVLD